MLAVLFGCQPAPPPPSDAAWTWVQRGDLLASQLKSDSAAAVYQTAHRLANQQFSADDIRHLRLEARSFLYALEYASDSFRLHVADLDRRFRAHPQTTAVDYAIINLQYAQHFLHLGNSQDALAFFLTARTYWEHQTQPIEWYYQDWRLGIVYLNIAVVHESLDMLESTEDYYQTALTTLERERCEVLSAIVLANIAVTDEANRAYQRSIDRAEAALEILVDSMPPGNYYVNNIRNNLGVCYYKIEEAEIARRMHQQVLDEAKTAPVPARVVTNAHLHLGNIERLEERHDRALKHLNDAYAYQQTQERPKLHLIEQQLGSLYTALDDRTRADHYHERSLRNVLSYYGSPNHAKVASQYLMMAESARAFGDLARMESALQSVQDILDFTDRQADFLSVPNWEITLDYYLARIDYEKLRFDATGNPEHLRRGVQHCEAATIMVDQIRAGTLNRSSRFTLQRNLSTINQLGLTLHLLLDEVEPRANHQQRAFQYAERQHHHLLFEDGQRQSSAPTTVRELMRTISHYEGKLYEELSYGEDQYEHVVKDLRHRLYVAKEELESLVHADSAVVPSVTESDLFDDLLALSETRSIVEYAEGTDHTYAFVFSRGAFRVYPLGNTLDLQQSVERLTDDLRNYPTPADSPAEQRTKWTDYLRSAHRVYRTVFQPLESELSERVVLIPTPTLASVPFEALVRSPDYPPDGSPPCLVLDFTFSTAYSGRLLRQHQRPADPTPTPSNYGILAYAPSYDLDPGAIAQYASTRNGRDLPPNLELFSLKHNQEEANDLVKTYGGQAVTGRRATERSFRENMVSYPIVHVAAHAFANERRGEHSRIAFAYDRTAPDGQRANLFAHEVMTMNGSQNELVTLSACETNAGEHKLGEGIVGMAHGFIQAGTRSVVATQWVVDDRATQQLMLGFYRKLYEGLPKDAAMAAVKRVFLKNHSVEEMRHPYFWAAPVVVGDVRPVGHYLTDSPPRFGWMFVALGLIVAIGLMVGLRYA